MLRPLWRTTCQTPGPHYQLRRIADARPFRAGDNIILREKLNRTTQPLLRSLKLNGRIESHRGVVLHDDIIGKRPRDIVRTQFPKPDKSGNSRKTRTTEFRLHEVRLEEYVRLSRRLVTPVYPADASLIVELLDLHPAACRENDGEGGEQKLEILEAGTGHGALTLYLSRAIHAANPSLPKHEDADADAAELSKSTKSTNDHWKSQRRAVIHTLDVSKKYSEHAEGIVKGFRNGLYYPNVDFYVSDVSAWTRRALAERSGETFLSHAILDLPNADHHLENVASALKPDGTLVVFNPSITQIMQCYSKVKEANIPLELDTVIELPVNGGAAGREWDVRAVKPRAASKPSSTGENRGSDRNEEREDSGVEVGSVSNASRRADTDSASDLEEAEGEAENWSMVCRPKVGERITGGGFLGVFKKQRDMRQD